MAIGDTYSVWMSSDGKDFFHICSDARLSYSVDYGGSVTGILGQVTGNAIFVDTTSGAVGKISITGTRINPSTSTDSTADGTTKLSNAAFIDKMKKMIENTQMFYNAYILRIYHADTRTKETYGSYKDLYVFLRGFDVDFSWTNLSEMSVSLDCVRRNKTRGFGSS